MFVRSTLVRALFALLAVVTAMVAGSTVAAAQPSPYDGRIVGTVTDAGAPVAGVQVIVYYSDSQYPIGRTTTGTDGTYVIEPIYAYSTYKIEFTTPDWRSQWAHQKTSFAEADVISVAPGQDTVVDEVLFPTAPTGSLQVTAVDAVTSEPIASFYGEANGDRFGSAGSTDTGTLTLAGLSPGEYRVSVYPRSVHFSASTTAVVVAGEITPVQLRLEPGATISTTVVDATTGQPVAGVCASASTDLQMLGLYQHTCSGPDGQLTFEPLRAASYRIFVRPRDNVHGAQWLGPIGGTGSRYLAAVVEARVGETATAPVVRLDGAGALRGTVTDEATGAPVRAMCAYPYATSTDAGPESGAHCSDDQGAYTITGLGPYYWPVEFVGDFTNNAYAWHWSGGRPNQLVAAYTQVTTGTTMQLDTTLTPAATIRGRVLQADGTPPGLGFVFTVNALTGDAAAPYALIDENGYYEVTSLAGQFVRLNFSGSGLYEHWYPNATQFKDATPVWVPPGGVTTGIDFTIPNG